MIERIKINIKYINNLGKKYIASIFSALGAIAVFFSINEYIDKIGYKIAAIVLIILAMYILAIVKFLFKNKKEILSKNGKKVIVKFDDIFLEEYKSKNVVIAIPVNRCFDTIANDKLVSSNTLHGKVINKIKENSELEYKNINQRIQSKLDNLKIEYKELKKEEKKQGNLKRYPVGTVVEYNSIGRNFYFIGLSEFDRNLHAKYTEQEHILTIQKLIEYHSTYGNGRDLVIPIIGGGNTGTNKKEKTILDMMVELIKFNENIINSNIYIIVRKKAKNEVSILDL